MAYTRAFFAAREEASLRSAQRVLPFVLDVVKPRSIVDLGCGTGTWLHAAKALGVESVRGVEGAWVRRARHLLPAGELEIADLNQRVRFEQTFDLAISLEVAEHLKPSRAQGFVEDLCAASSVVLFGAAIPAQGGTGHVNEQWQSYWVERFAECGYECLDIVRPHFWDASEVLPWYKQNALLYASATASQVLGARIPPGLIMSGRSRIPFNVVHPDMYSRLFEDPPLRLGMRISREFFRKVLRTMVPWTGREAKA